ncbi:MAG: hypothetical protein SPL71_05095 [Oribacterium sp.]|nr:hypothetical protein [Oribacterium sp.]
MPPKTLCDERREFVQKLEEALLMIEDFRGIEYRHKEVITHTCDEVHNKVALHWNCLELIRIDWRGEGDPHIYLDVTMKSLSEILLAVTLELTVLPSSEELPDTAKGDWLWKRME